MIVGLINNHIKLYCVHKHDDAQPTIWRNFFFFGGVGTRAPDPRGPPALQRLQGQLIREKKL